MDFLLVISNTNLIFYHRCRPIRTFIYDNMLEYQSWIGKRQAEIFFTFFSLIKKN